MSPLTPTKLLDCEPTSDAFHRDVVAGLRKRPKQLRSKYFYDERGSELFDQICQLDEYYLTRTEFAIMKRDAAEMAAQIGPGVRLVEFGSGSSIKTRILLDHLPDPIAYVPVDISREHLHKTANRLSQADPHIEMLPVCADFTKPFDLPNSQRESTHTAVYFPGSTIGNLQPDDARVLLSRIAALCGDGGGLLIGFDLQKDVEVLEAAYNDSKTVTAEFNLNMLRRINRELDADFDVDQFEHVAFYNDERGRIEMHLRSRRRQTVEVLGDAIDFAKDETICTEYSHKYTIEGFAAMAAEAGLTLRRHWTDSRRYFAVAHFAVAEPEDG